MDKAFAHNSLLIQASTTHAAMDRTWHMTATKAATEAKDKT
jgi:hypothetical protein